MALFLVPLGVGMFVYQDFIVQILLGSQWKLAGIVLGSWALSSSLVTAISYLISEAFRAKGMPNISFLAQMLHLIVLIPVIYICVQYDFTTFCLCSFYSTDSNDWCTFISLSCVCEDECVECNF
ncbi:MAG: hypothetical protein ACLTJ8_05020 [Veillonella atypica]